MAMDPARCSIQIIAHNMSNFDGLFIANSIPPEFDRKIIGKRHFLLLWLCFFLLHQPKKNTTTTRFSTTCHNENITIIRLKKYFFSGGNNGKFKVLTVSTEALSNTNFSSFGRVKGAAKTEQSVKFVFVDSLGMICILSLSLVHANNIFFCSISKRYFGQLEQAT